MFLEMKAQWLPNFSVNNPEARADFVVVREDCRDRDHIKFSCCEVFLAGQVWKPEGNA